MRQRSHYQPLTHDIRLPDEMQADALWLLEESRRVINATLVALWPYLDDFIEEDTGPAWQQVGQFISSPFPHGDRQWRCESETAGCIMRAQADRKQVFLQVAPILWEGFIRPKEEKRPAGKNRKQIKEAITALQKTLSDDETSFVTSIVRGIQDIAQRVEVRARRGLWIGRRKRRYCVLPRSTWCHQGPDSLTNLDTCVLAALDRSSLPAFLPHSGRLAHQVSSVRGCRLERPPLDQR